MSDTDQQDFKIAFRLGVATESIWDNPYWLEYPNRSAKGFKDEAMGRVFVDGWCSKYTSGSVSKGIV